jgi:hypothetical protein
MLAKNSLFTIAGTTPYEAVLGRHPPLLAESESPGASQLDDNDPQSVSRHVVRLRELALQSMVEESAQQRIRRAANAKTLRSGQQLEYQVGQLVDIFRPARSNDESGWRGPAKIIGLSSLDSGFIDVSWGGRAMAIRLQDSRPALMYHSLMEDQETPAMSTLRTHLAQMAPGVETYMALMTETGWMMSKSAKEISSMLYALCKVARENFGMEYYVGGRVGRNIASLSGLNSMMRSIMSGGLITTHPCIKVSSTHLQQD